jgi:hypothetical protein
MKRARKIDPRFHASIHGDKFDRPPMKHKCGYCKIKKYLKDGICDACMAKRDSEGLNAQL